MVGSVVSNPTFTMAQLKEQAIKRAKLAQRVFVQNEGMRGHNEFLSEGPTWWDHSYVEHDGLVIYLLLTCFDILGQDRAFMDFGSWLHSEMAATALRQDESPAAPPLVKAHSLFMEYSKQFGVRRSFYRFANEQLRQESRATLLGSIRAYVGGTIQEVDERTKLDFLFGIRNTFTHRGGSDGLYNRALMPQRVHIKRAKELAGWERLSNWNKLTMHVRKWPFVLFEVLAEQLGVEELAYPKIRVEVHVHFDDEVIKFNDVPYRDACDIDKWWSIATSIRA